MSRHRSRCAAIVSHDLITDLTSLGKSSFGSNISSLAVLFHHGSRTMSTSNTLLRVSRRAVTAASRVPRITKRGVAINSAEKGNKVSTEEVGDQKLRQAGDDLLSELRKAPRPRMSTRLVSRSAPANVNLQPWASCPRR